VNVEPLPDALTTVTSPRIMRASLRVIASPRPELPKRCAVEASAWVHLGHAASLRRHGPQKCMKIRRGCSVSMWLWIAVTSMPLDRKALITGFTSSAVSTKSPVMAALPPPVGCRLSSNRSAGASGGGNRCHCANREHM
jgi:hypothetical protein